MKRLISPPPYPATLPDKKAREEFFDQVFHKLGPRLYLWIERNGQPNGDGFSFLLGAALWDLYELSHGDPSKATDELIERAVSEIIPDDRFFTSRSR